MKTAIITVNQTGRTVAGKICHTLDATLLARHEVGAHWNDFDAFVFVGAMGICVRTIAPYIEDKHSDPAVVCVDTLGRSAVAVLSGHVGGANELAQRVAAATGAQPVVTTQSDLAGLWALDTLEKEYGWHREMPDDMNACIFDFVNRRPTALFLEADDEGCRYLRETLPEHVTLVERLEEAKADRYRLLIMVTPYRHEVPQGMHCVWFVPRVATIGFGLAHHPADYQNILSLMEQRMEEQGLAPACARQYCTIDVKADEPFVRLLRDRGCDVRFFTAEELSSVEVPHPSATVEKHVGTPSVCEAAAILGSGGGQLVMPKQKGKSFTVAVAIVEGTEVRGCEGTRDVARGTEVRGCEGARDDIGGEGFIEIVGAGPGDPDLISVRGRRMLEKADLILYAGSLVPKELTECHKAGAVVRSSADMNLDEQCQLMKEHYDRGHFIVRLHTGDPCIFGAIQEQMAFFDREGMRYHITPGISSFLAAAAELRSQFTIPERTQTIILTRGEGRTPMPEREKLHLLARSQSTMCIFLSAAIVDDVQQQLLQEYPPETPVAACYHLTWPDQHIYRGVLKDLAKIVHDNHLTLTTMLVVGEAIDNRQGLSELYNKHFTHLFRRGTD